MRLDRNELTKAVKAAISMGAVAAMGVAGTALAQNPAPAQNNGQNKPETLQTIVVTGSHVRRVDLETDNPVTTVTAQQLQATGKLTIGAVISQLPVVTGGLITPQVDQGGGGRGATLVGLRGLGASRTLVLVDGQRVLSSDLNSIPTAAVQSVQVLKSGASAIYGSDAIGGVINIILKQNYQGAQFRLNYGISDQHDAKQTGASFMFGQTSDKGSILAGVSYQKVDSILAADRTFGEAPLTRQGTTANGGPRLVATGSSSAPRLFITVPHAIAKKFGCPTGGALSLNPSTFDAGTSPTAPGDYHCFNIHDQYNFDSSAIFTTPQERTNGFFKGDYHLTDNIDMYATYYHEKITSVFGAAPGILDSADVAPGPFISKDSYYNPFGVDFTARNGNVWRSRLIGTGVRLSTSAIRNDQLIMGFKGAFSILGQDWQWNLGYDYGHLSTTNTQTGQPNTTTLLPGVGPSFFDPAEGKVVCGTPGNIISGCTPWDPFNLNSPSAVAAQKASSSPVLTESWQIERVYHAEANGPLIMLPAGQTQLAVGVQYRKEYSNDVVGPLQLLDPETLSCPLGSDCSGHLQGGFNVKEAYAELFIPILRDLPFAYGLNVTLADRYSKYSDFGSTSNWKIGMEYRPIHDLLLRGTVSRVFRAPTIGDLFAPPGLASPFIGSDPCNHITAANPACVGVPLDGSFFNRQQIADNPTGGTQVRGVAEGGEEAGFPLGPEQGKSFDFGVVYSPSQIPGFTAQADIWRIYLNDQIGRIGVQTTLNQCFAGVLKFCPLIERYQSGPSVGQILNLIIPTGNLGRMDVKGVDFDANYRLPNFSFGQFVVGVQATYMTQFKIQTAPGTDGNAVIEGAGLMGGLASTLGSVCPFAGGGVCFFPRVRARGHVSWQRGPWSAEWIMRYSSPFRMAGGARHGGIKDWDYYGSWVYNDFNVGYDIQPINTVIHVGMNNVFDKQPPILGMRAFNGNTDPSDFDVIGRYYWARMTVNF